MRQETPARVFLPIFILFLGTLLLQEMTNLYELTNGYGAKNVSFFYAILFYVLSICLCYYIEPDVAVRQ